jgi:hypothetical protein
MIELPDHSRRWEAENDFYLTSDVTRMGKALAHYELFQRTRDLPGAIVECGVFKGASFVRMATFRELFTNRDAKRLIGFDTFGAFPETSNADDEAARRHFLDQAGAESIGVQQLHQVLEWKELDHNVELVAGDILETVPRYVEAHPELRISLLNLDTDVLEPARVILEHLYPLVVRGGILIVDDYGSFAGESQAVDEYFAGTGVRVQKLPFCQTPCFVQKP